MYLKQFESYLMLSSVELKYMYKQFYVHKPVMNAL